MVFLSLPVGIGLPVFFSPRHVSGRSGAELKRFQPGEGTWPCRTYGRCLPCVAYVSIFDVSVSHIISLSVIFHVRSQITNSRALALFSHCPRTSDQWLFLFPIRSVVWSVNTALMDMMLYSGMNFPRFETRSDFTLCCSHLCTITVSCCLCAFRSIWKPSLKKEYQASSISSKKGFVAHGEVPAASML